MAIDLGATACNGALADLAGMVIDGKPGMTVWAVRAHRIFPSETEPSLGCRPGYGVGG